MTTPAHDEQSLLMDYLLGRVADEGARQQLEERLMTDGEYFEALLVAEDELIDEYAHGTLAPADRAQFEQHFLITPERQRKLRFAQALHRHVNRQRENVLRRLMRWFVRPLRGATFFSSPVAVALALVVVAALGLFMWRAFSPRSEVAEGLAALSSAYRTERPTEARISGLAYAPWVQTRGAARPAGEPDARERAELLLRQAARNHPDATTHHALGQFYLTERKYDQAISELEEALKAAPDDARLHSDLGAALLEAGQAEADPGKGGERFARSLEHLDRALALAPVLREALFNRALCYEHMLLPQQAESAWRKYLETDARSPWAVEARRHLEEIEVQKKRAAQDKEQLFQDFIRAQQTGDDERAWDIIRQHRDLRGGFLLNRLLDAYLAAAAQGQDEEAKRNLQLLIYAGQLERQHTDDQYISTLANYYRTLSPARLSVLMQARGLLRQAHDHLGLSQLAEARAAYERAEQMFQQAGDAAEAVSARYPLGHCFLLESDLARSRATFQEVARACVAAHYKGLLAQTLNGLAIVEMGLNNYSAALEQSQRSLALSEQIGDTSGMMKTTHQLGEEYVYLNNYEMALSLHLRSLALTTRYAPEPIQLWRNYFSIARPLNLLGLTTAAVEYQREALRLALMLGVPQTVCRSYINLGLMLGSLHRYDEATENVRRAFELGQQFSDQQARTETTAYSSLQLGNLYRQAGAHEKAIENYDEAIRLYDKLRYPAFNYVAHKGRLLSCMARGDYAAAEQEIGTALDLFEHYRARIREESNRNSFFNAEQSIYDVAIDYAYTRRGDARTAFDYAERSRARSLLDYATNDAPARSDSAHAAAVAPSQPLSLAEIQARLPAEVQLLQYAVLDDKLLIWVVTRDNFISGTQAVGAKELNEKVLAYLHSVSRPPAGAADETQQRAADLYELLVKPVESALDKRKQLSIVPDKALNHLPFGALYSRVAGKYLVEQYTISHAPSANVLVVCSEKARRQEGNVRERVLSVGNPHFDRQAFPVLTYLPAARREAEAVAACYGLPQPVTETDATKSRVVEGMQRAEVVHLALHSVVDEQSPLRSKLLLAGGAAQPEPDGVLSAQEIYGLKLPLTRLVVLSSCDSGVERYYGGEGMIGLARPFVAAGVPLVVASLWPVDSDATAELMINFHRQRTSAHLPTAAALRQAQLALLARADNYRHPYYWAAFITIGGYASF